MSPEKKQTSYDVIVIGAGHNGLVAAAYLAKAGRNVLLLEKREMVGGAAVTEELFPGFKISSLADGAGSFSPTVVDDLNLKKYGLEILHTTPLIFSPQLDGNNLVIWQDVNRTVEEISKFSAADGEAYPKFIERMRKFSRIISELNNVTPPDLPEIGLVDMFGYRKVLRPVRNLGWKNIDQLIRFIPLSLSDLLREWFESEVVRAAIGASAIINISLGPQESGTAYTFLYNWSCSNNGLFRANGQVNGGIGALTEAIAQAAKSFGVEILTGFEVSKIIIDGGRAKGVVLSNGNQISASTIVSATDMHTTFSELVDDDYLDQTFIKHVQNIKYGGTTARAHFVLDQLPTFTSMNGDAQQYLGGHIQISPSLTYIQKAYDPVKYGEFSEQPYLDIRIPTFTDPYLSPEGKHLMSVTAKYMPYHLRGGDWDNLRDKLRDLVIDTISKYEPDFPQIVENSHIITPLDMETTYHLPEGNPVHGDMTLDRFLWMRPIPGYAQYCASVDGLYLCSAATHPGGGVTGLNGKNAAGVILKKR